MSKETQKQAPTTTQPAAVTAQPSNTAVPAEKPVVTQKETVPVPAPAPEPPITKAVESQETAKAAAPAAETVPASKTEVPVEKPAVTEKEAVPVPVPESATVVTDREAPEPEPEPENVAASEAPATEEETTTAVEAGKVIAQSVSFKEESNVVSELPEAQRKALDELKELVREALSKHEFTAPPPPPPAPVKEETKEEEVKAEEEIKEEEKKEVEEGKKDEKKEVKEEKIEEKKEEVKEEKKEEKIEETKPVPPPTAETKLEEKPAEAAAPAIITIEKAFAAADDDGSKTVEAIEETVVTAAQPPQVEAPKEAETVLEPEEVSIWGIPLLQDERSDVILLKFLRARDFKVKEAFTMLKNTVRWRKEYKIDELLEEDLGNEFEKIVFLHGVDKEGRPVCYNSYNEFQNKELFADKEKRQKFLRWRIQFQEKCVRALDFSPTKKSSFVYISDFKNAPGLGKIALWQFIKQAVKLFEDNYPEFVAKEVFINVPWWYIPYYMTIGSFTSPRTKSKMILAGPSKSADAIFKYVAPEHVPVKYGGLKAEIEQEFNHEDTATEVIIKAATKQTIELPASEVGTLLWELRVSGSEVTYGAQFEPSNEGSYTVIVSKARKVNLTDEPVITDTFKVAEPGKVVITIDNQSYRKKKLLYRFKTKPSSD